MHLCCLEPGTVSVVYCFRSSELQNLEKCSIRKLWRILWAFERYNLQFYWINRMGVTAIWLCCCFSSREELQISCSCPYTRVSIGWHNALILVSSSIRMCKLCLVSPSLSFLKGGSQVEEFASWSILRSSLRSGSVVVPKDVRETQNFNEVWLKVQWRFIQDHQDFGRATGEAFKLVWIRNLRQVFEEIQ